MRDVVLVTGAGGFIGSAVVRRLVNSPAAFADGRPVGHVVAMLKPGGSTVRLDELPRSAYWSFAYADLEDEAGLPALLQAHHPRAILHLGMNQALHQALPEARLAASIDRPLATLFTALQGVAGARLVTTGSAAVLRPGIRMAEDTVVEPNAAYESYARSKIREEQLLPRLGAASRVPWLHLRLFYTFGKYEAPNRLLPYIVGRLAQGKVAQLSSGERVRDFTDVDEVASAYAAALCAADQGCGTTYHIGTGRGISVRDFALAVAGSTGRSELLQFASVSAPDQGQEFIVADPARARTALGWSASTDTVGRIQDASRWWLRHMSENNSLQAESTHGQMSNL